MKIRELREQLLTKKIGVYELVKSYLETIEKNKDLNAYTYISEDVLKEANIAQEQINKGEVNILTGIPISIKDNINVSNMPTTNGSSLFTKNKIESDSAIVSNLKRAGAIILGKTNMDELAMGGTGEASFFGPSLNPHDKFRTAGGSSCGAAVSVAANLCVAAIGTDTGGSISGPASFCGITGYKPSHNLLDTGGVFKMVPQMDAVGPLAHSSEDCMEILYCMSGFNFDYRQEPYENLKGFSIAVIEQLLEEPIIKPLTEVIDFLKDKGATINYVSFEEAKEEIYPYYAYSICSKFMDENLKSHQHLLGAEALRRLNLGREFIKNGSFNEAVHKREILIKKSSEILSKNMFIIGPTSNFSAPKFGEDKQNICTDWMNLVGLPNISTPMRVDGLPIGLSITSYPNMDGRILSIAHLIETW